MRIQTHESLPVWGKMMPERTSAEPKPSAAMIRDLDMMQSTLITAKGIIRGQSTALGET